MKQFMNIVLPMAGRGSRFKKAGYTVSKPFIDVNGTPMVIKVIKNLKLEFNSSFNFIIICLKEDYVNHHLNDLLKENFPDCNFKIVILDSLTEGAAQSVLSGKEYFDNTDPLLILNSDQLIEYNPNRAFSELSLHDGGILCFDGKGPEWSYAKLDDEGYVTEVAEKIQISNCATAGYYYWNRGRDFIKYAEHMISNNDRSKNEFYVAPVFNYAIQDKKRIVVHMVDKIDQLGTPEYLQQYLFSEK